MYSVAYRLPSESKARSSGAMMSPPFALTVSTAPVAMSTALIWLPVTCATKMRPSGPVRSPLAPNSRLGSVILSSRQPGAVEGLCATYRAFMRSDVSKRG